MASSPTPPPEPPQRSYGYSPGQNPLAGMTLPVNPELLVYVVVIVIIAIITLASDAVNAAGFVTALSVVTVGYLISRGVAKASRVLEN
jgi:hypothetical protein